MNGLRKVRFSPASWTISLVWNFYGATIMTEGQDHE
jgi:hypothetical protein